MKNIKDLHQEVQQLLAAEPSLRNCLQNIYILVNDTVVMISGTVENQELKKLIRKKLSEIPGIGLLIEELNVDPVKPERQGVEIDWNSGTMQLTH